MDHWDLLEVSCAPVVFAVLAAQGWAWGTPPGKGGVLTEPFNLCTSVTTGPHWQKLQ